METLLIALGWFTVLRWTLHAAAVLCQMAANERLAQREADRQVAETDPKVVPLARRRLHA